MPRRRWEELPEGVRRDVERHTGSICSVSPIPTGAASDIAVTIDADAGRIFCKGGEVDGPFGWLYRNEARLNPWLPAAAPRLLWTVERGGWLLLGFEHAAGRHPDLAPGSPDLAPLAALLDDLGRRLTPCPSVAVPSIGDRWRPLIAPELVDGDTLLHTDMTPRNFLIETRSDAGETPTVRLVDWSGPACGAAWIDTALLLLRLIRAGHDPAAAEEWGRQVPAYADAPEAALTAFADALVVLWQRKQHAAPAPHHGPLLDAARRWAAHRTCPHRRGSSTAPAA
ncbi:hypothetical protein GA0070606_2138 [Micromonospora citrea]|uniref:Phosphotransferase enzyme family protein n=1 Tax=Micromonospora citrea TaxID=47855 RepID=A0A1C6UHI8_9ACTN|nr:hypothetical protein [Micromonospora citrea]SCL53540.1 hypothetical protein GA0070606_2138 [Micromonospora citrea]